VIPVRRPVLVVLALLAAVLSASVLVACGGSDEKKQDPEQVLKDTFTGKKKLDSGKLDVALDLRAKDGSTGSIRLNGPFQTNGIGKVPSFDFGLTLTTGGQSLDAGFVSTGTAAYVQLRGTSYKLDDSTFEQFASGYTSAQGTQGTSGTSSLGAFGVDPRSWLRDPKIAGTESVGGTKTIHITAGIDVAPLVADLNRMLGKAGSATGQKVPQSLTPAQVTQAAKALRNVKVDVFTGESDKTLRRFVVDVGLALAPGQTIVGMTPSGVRLSLAFTDLNAPQTIVAPKGAKPFSALQSELQGLIGAVSGQGGGGTGTTTTPGASGSAASKYLTCVQKAGQDIAKLQKCASLVGQ
jgi:hypothetical protein